ncbi:MAG: hypothetical protein WA005_03775, partial [Candidatus Binataceae bacterium]
MNGNQKRRRLSVIIVRSFQKPGIILGSFLSTPASMSRLWTASRGSVLSAATRWCGQVCGARPTNAAPSPLAGKLFDERAECLSVAGAAKGEPCYRYYVSRRLVAGSAEKAPNGWRLAAPEISAGLRHHGRHHHG